MKKLFLLLALVVLMGCVGQAPKASPSPAAVSNSEPITLLAPPKHALSQHYVAVQTDVKAAVPEYSLPLQAGGIANFDDFSGKVSLGSKAVDGLLENGFVAVQMPYETDYVTDPYKWLKDKEIPVFITTDSLLHLYHIQFDESLRQIEEREFYRLAWDMSNDMVKDSQAKYAAADGEAKEALRKNIAFFSVALKLLEPKPEQVCGEKDRECIDSGEKFLADDAANYSFEVPDLVKGDVEAELELISAHRGFKKSPLFTYKEDYSQYAPRGHYTRSEKLKNYFKALMWFGRMSFILKGGCGDCIVTEKEARIQTMSASMIAAHFAEDEKLSSDWDRIYSVTSFYVGLSDDLTPYEYLGAMDEVFGGELSPNDLNSESLGLLKAKLAEYRGPKIYGGTGACKINPPFSPEQADECLGNTKGMRFMGQRFIPDSYLFSNMVFPYTGSFTGNRTTFTGGWAGRFFPRGLDVMALLGSERADYWLAELQDNAYSNYSTQFNKMKAEFDGFDEKDWNKNLYWAWLYSLKPLLAEFGDGYPVFMQSGAWQDKELNTALASWAELRHDTILYAKQSYTMKATSVEPEKPVVGYVEPVPEFYARLLALTRMTKDGLNEMKVIDSVQQGRLDSMESILERLLDISQRELRNGELTQNDYNFIKNFAGSLEGTIEDVDKKAQKTTVIADVHTDINSKQALEEGVGHVGLLVVAYKVPDGRILVGAGPVLSHYEFKHPMADRLTDEKWREMLGQGEVPEKPEWTGTYSVP